MTIKQVSYLGLFPVRDAAKGFLIGLGASDRYAPSYLDALERSLAFLATYAEAEGWPAVHQLTLPGRQWPGWRRRSRGLFPGYVAREGLAGTQPVKGGAMKWFQRIPTKVLLAASLSVMVLAAACGIGNTSTGISPTMPTSVAMSTVASPPASPRNPTGYVEFGGYARWYNSRVLLGLGSVSETFNQDDNIWMRVRIAKAGEAKRKYILQRHEGAGWSTLETWFTTSTLRPPPGELASNLSLVLADAVPYTIPGEHYPDSNSHMYLISGPPRPTYKTLRWLDPGAYKVVVLVGDEKRAEGSFTIIPRSTPTSTEGLQR